MTNYEKYQLQWMIDHNVSLDDLIEEMQDVATDDIRYWDTLHPYDVIQDSFSAVIYDTGFAGGQMFACEREWQECEGKVFQSC